MTTKTKNLVPLLNEINGADESLGRLLRSLRQCENMTLKEFALKLGVSFNYLSDVEHGRKVVSPRKAYNYANILGYPAEEFVRLALQDETNIFIRDKGLHANIAIQFA